MGTFRLSPYENGGSFRVTSPIGYRTNPITKKGTGAHYGMDLVGTDTSCVVALKEGKVVRSRIVTNKNDPTWQWGNYVAVESPDGYIIYYCHLAERLVTTETHVLPGTPLGIEGATGLVTGRHLHLEMRKGSRQCDLNSIDSDDCSVAALMGIPNKTGQYCAPKLVLDNEPTDWSTDAIRWAVENKILIGDENGNYLLRSGATREETLVFLHRAIKSISSS